MMVSNSRFPKEFEAGTDPIFAALAVLRQAREAHAERLRDLDDALLSSPGATTNALIAWRLYRLHDLEIDEAQAASFLPRAEQAFLTMPPTSLAGSMAVLTFLQDYLKAEPDLSLASKGVGNVVAVLSAIP